MKAKTITYIQNLFLRELEEAGKARDELIKELEPYKAAIKGVLDPLRRAELFDQDKITDLRRRIQKAEDRILDAEEAKEDFIHHDWY